ncbi:MAG: class I SAM-dependent RNA methyltransferase, partial [Planctomycetaceae bacterium]|nr:class I SAM-dependent RNA methyltransferase [Planctomycetaceae bacterium]
MKKAVSMRLGEAYGELPETGPRYAIEVALRDDLAMLTIDTTGDGLHKRGYRPLTGEAPLRETLAAALVMLSFWREDRPLLDPFCGTGTIPIEAAMIGRNIAPGLRRSFMAESWPQFAAAEQPLWENCRAAARSQMREGLSERIMGTDISPEALKMARFHASEAGVADDIHFQQRNFADLTSKREYGCLITNPPYG